MLTIFSILSGFMVYSWKGCKIMGNGNYFVPVKLQVWLIARMMSIITHTRNIEKVKRRHSPFGLSF